MLKSIELENYKCFKSRTSLEVAPLTVLCGVNSSGKSSILKSLLLLKQSYEDALCFNELIFHGKYVDNSFKDSLYKGNDTSSESLVIQNSFRITKSKTKHDEDSGIVEVDATIFNELCKIFKFYENQNCSQIACFDVSISLKVYSLLKDCNLSKNAISEYKIVLSMLKDKNGVLEPLTDKKIIITLSKTRGIFDFVADRIYDILIENLPYEVDDKNIIFTGGIQKCSCDFEGVKLVKLEKENDEIKDIGTILTNVYALFRVISEQYQNIKSISPLRNMTTKRYILDESVNSAGNGGEYTTQALYTYDGKQIMAVNPPEDGYLKLGNINTESLMCATKKWANYLGIGELEIMTCEDRINLNIAGSNLADVGLGISQGLSVVVAGLLSNRCETLLLEQPEIHLHPSMQLKMADFLLMLASSEKNVIVETHSDHIVNRIVHRMMEDPSINNKVKIYFVEKNQNGIASIENIIVDPIKGVTNGNKNFFTQCGVEQMEIAKTGYENKLKNERSSVSNNLGDELDRLKCKLEQNLKS